MWLLSSLAKGVLPWDIVFEPTWSDHALNHFEIQESSANLYLQRISQSNIKNHFLSLGFSLTVGTYQ